MAEVFQIPVADVFQENCYVYGDPQTHHAVMIDPGAEPERLIAWAEQNGWTIDRILLTHGHFDHTGAVNTLREYWNIPVFASLKSDEYLSNPFLNLSEPNNRFVVVENVHHFQEGENVLPDLMNGTLKVIATPGHTPDSVTFYDPESGLAFVGDAMFKGEPGIWKFPGGNKEELFHSIRTKLLQLPDQTLLLSGHSAPTTPQAEKPLYFL